MNQKLKTGLLFALAAVLFLAAALFRDTARTRFEAIETDDDRFYLPPSTWLRLFCLGYNEAFADLIWVKAILHFGKNMFIKDAERLVTNYIDAALDLDPRFQRLYVAGSVLSQYQNRGKPSKKTMDIALGILERGHKVYPNDGEIAFNLGFMHYNEMQVFVPKDPNNPERKYHRDRGRRLIGQSAFMPGVPPYAAEFSISLFSDDSMADLRVAHLQALLARETQPAIRKAIIESLTKELGAAAKRDIETTNRLQAEWRREMPFVPFDFYALLSPDHTPADVIDPLLSFDRILGIYEDGERAR